MKIVGEYDAIITDTPYYDAIPYFDLMDFFYVWLRRSLHGASPEIDSAFRTDLKCSEGLPLFCVTAARFSLWGCRRMCSMSTARRWRNCSLSFFRTVIVYLTSVPDISFHPGPRSNVNLFGMAKACDLVVLLVGSQALSAEDRDSADCNSSQRVDGLLQSPRKSRLDRGL